MDDWDSFDAPPPVASGSGSTGRKHTLFTDSLKASTSHPASLCRIQLTSSSTVTSDNPLALLRKRAPPPPTPSSSTTKRRARYALPAPTPEELAASASATAAHRVTLETLLTAREKRLGSLSLALRELELQRLRMMKGTKKGLISKFVAQGEEGEGDEIVEKGLKTGARVWVSGMRIQWMGLVLMVSSSQKWKSERKR